MPQSRSISTDAKAGKILILIGMIINVITFPIIILLGVSLVLVSYGTISGFMNYSKTTPVFGLDVYTGGLVFVVIGVLIVIGLILKIMAYKFASQNEDFRKAGTYGIVASFIPPLDAFSLIGGILCLVSKEAGKRKR